MVADDAPPGDIRAVLRPGPFRRLWYTMLAASIGDWLGLLASMALASALAGTTRQSLFAVSGVLVVRMLPALLLGPFAGAIADRLDRRMTMVNTDLARFVLYVSVPVVSWATSPVVGLAYLLVVTFLVECVTLFFIPAKEASVPNLVPRERLEAANQVNLLTSYGTAPLAAVLFFLLATIGDLLRQIPTLEGGFPQIYLAFYVNGLAYLYAAFVTYRLTEISEHGAAARRRQLPRTAGEGLAPAAATVAPGAAPETPHEQGLFASITEGWKYAGRSQLIRGLIMGMLGAFAAGGVVAGLARNYVATLGGGERGFSVLFATVFVGLAIGMFVGPRLLRDLSRRRLFGMSIVSAGLCLVVTSVVPNLVLVVLFVLAIGSFAGMAWVTGYTLIGSEVADEIRGRTWALIQSLVRVTLLFAFAAGPAIAGVLEGMRWDVGPITVTSIPLVLFVSGVLTIVVGVLSYRQMDDHPNVSLGADFLRLVRQWTVHQPPGHPFSGAFIVFEGCEGSGKSTQARLLAEWLRTKGVDPVVTREPGATELGQTLRGVLLDRETGNLAPRAEAFLYAADRAQHVESLIRPALEDGRLVISDRYVDSTVAYQGAGRGLPDTEIREICRIATAGVRPDLTIVLDIDVEAGLSRTGRDADRIEAEPREFHERVRRSFLSAAAKEPRHYTVIDASMSQREVTRCVRQRVKDFLEDWQSGRMQPRPEHHHGEPSPSVDLLSPNGAAPAAADAASPEAAPAGGDPAGHGAADAGDAGAAVNDGAATRE